MKRFLPAAAALTLFASCISTSVTPLSNDVYEAIPAENVDIYLEEGDIPYAYEKVAIIYASGSTNMTSQDKMLRKVREEAAKIGANGILLEEIDEPSQLEKLAGAIFENSTNREGEMVAIKVFHGVDREEGQTPEEQ